MEPGKTKAKQASRMVAISMTGIKVGEWWPLTQKSRPSRDALVVVVFEGKERLGKTYWSDEPEDEGLCIHVEDVATWNIDQEDRLPELFIELPIRQ